MSRTWSKLFSMPLESWKTFFEIGGVILLFLTFVFGAGALFTGKRINERQSEQLRQFNMELSAQQERAAVAERSLLELQERLRDRKFNDKQRTQLVNLLSMGARCRVEVIAGVNDDEATRFATIVLGILHDAGWQAEPFTIAQTNLASGISLANTAGDKTEPCTENLWNAFDSIGMRPKIYEGTPAKNSVQLLIGSKPKP
jgi:hypothetical protein